MRPAVAITGISGNLGRVVAKLLHRKERIIGIDRRPFPGKPKDLEHHALDLRKRKCEDIFRKENLRALVHMGFMHDPRAEPHEQHSFNVLELVGATRKYSIPLGEYFDGAKVTLRVGDARVLRGTK